jgi:two-component system NtrC family sensor kinase
MLFQIILAIVLLNYLRRSPHIRGVSMEWSQRLFIGQMACVALLLFDLIVDKSGIISRGVADLILLAILYLLYSKKEFQFAKFLVFAVLPLVVICIFQDLARLINPRFYGEWKDSFDMAYFFGFVWLFAAWFITKRQRKTMERERMMALEREKEYRVTESIKAELEVQVEERTAALTKQKQELQQTITELKATQAQLIQSEKMASLGELTAGIAHEIQNPLNFVNNFSEVSTELVDELNQEIASGNIEEVKVIANDLKQNLEKINHHGKRAGDIVKGMLQHSRSSTGVKEPTEINNLADEYLRLAYHGLRAKDKTFNAIMKTDYDERIGKINIVAQDIGRVILNLITNAFYSVNEKSKSIQQDNAEVKYQPTVTVNTKLVGGRVEIRVADNGNGIPQQVIDKIFQPFFTTKPAGQGTGLGLSLSYDIVKAHGGKIRAHNKETGGAEFVILLPKLTAGQHEDTSSR